MPEANSPASPDIVTGSPGIILKRCREHHGITIEDAAETTRIGLNYLKALEADNIHEFVNTAYLKGFLRIYAIYLGLNPEDLLHMYDKLIIPSEQGNSSSSTETSERELRRRRFSWQKLALPAFLLLLIIVTASFMNRNQPPASAPASRGISSGTDTLQAQAFPQRSTAKALSDATNVSQQPASDKAVVESGAESETPEGAASLPEQQSQDLSRSFILRMKVLQNGNLTVTIDGSSSQNYELSVGDVIEWKASKSIVLDLSNSGGVEAELNGKTLKPFGSPGKPGFVVLDAEGVRK